MFRVFMLETQRVQANTTVNQWVNFPGILSVEFLSIITGCYIMFASFSLPSYMMIHVKCRQDILHGLEAVNEESDRKVCVFDEHVEAEGESWRSGWRYGQRLCKSVNRTEINYKSVIRAPRVTLTSKLSIIQMHSTSLTSTILYCTIPRAKSKH